jgi:hypothetical protein
MVDNIKLNKILPRLSPAPKVKRTDQRRRNDQQNPFEEVFKKKRAKKKKKADLENAATHDSGHSTDDEQSALHAAGKDADKEDKSGDSSSNRIIDIRV